MDDTHEKLMDCLEEITRFETECDQCGALFEHNVGFCDYETRCAAVDAMIAEGWTWEAEYGPICPACKTINDACGSDY